MINRNSKNPNPNLAYYTHILNFDRYNLYIKAQLIAAKLDAMLAYVATLEKQMAFHKEELTFFYQQLAQYFIYNENHEYAKLFAEKYFKSIKEKDSTLAKANYTLGSALLLDKTYDDPTHFETAIKLCENLAKKDDTAEILRAQSLMQIAKIKARKTSDDALTNAFFSYDEALSALLRMVKRNKKLYHDIAYIYQAQGELRMQQGKEAEARVLFAGAATAWDKFNAFMGSEHPQLNRIPFIKQKITPPEEEVSENSLYIENKLTSFLKKCVYTWPDAVTPESLNPTVHDALNYIQTLLDKKIGLGKPTQKILTELIYKLGTYQIYVNDDPASVMLLLQTLEDKLEGYPLAYLRNHLAYGYSQLLKQAKETDENIIAPLYEKNMRVYSDLMIDDYREPRNLEEIQILAYTGFIVGMCDFHKKHYGNAMLNIEHSINECDDALLPSLKLAFTDTLIAVNHGMAILTFSELERYWEQYANPSDLRAAQFYKQYADFLATQSAFRDKAKAYEMYQKAYHILLAHPMYAPKLRQSIQQMIVNGDVFLKEKENIVLFKPEGKKKDSKTEEVKLTLTIK